MNEVQVDTKDSHYVAHASVFPFESDSLFNASQRLHSVTETIAEIFLPEHRNTFMEINWTASTQSTTFKQYFQQHWQD